MDRPSKFPAGVMPYHSSASVGVGAEHVADLIDGPRVEQALVPVAVGSWRVSILGRGEPAGGLSQIAQHVVDGLGDDLSPSGLVERRRGVGVDPHEQRLVVEHLLEVRHEPLRSTE